MIRPNELPHIAPAVPHPSIERRIDASIAEHHRRGGQWPAIVKNTRGGWSSDDIEATLAHYRANGWDVMRSTGDSVLCSIAPRVDGDGTRTGEALREALREAEGATKVGYGARVDSLIERLGTDLTPDDFLGLAQACFGQAGLDLATQRRVQDIIWAASVNDFPSR